MSEIDAPEIVRATGVSKKFVVRRDNSLKERLVTFGRLGRRHREEFWALDDVTLSITAGTTIGLIGHNGSGKSTLLKVIGGIIDPTSGTVETRGRIAALLELGAGFHPDLTGRENVYLNASILGLTRAQTDERLEGILEFASIGDFIDTQVKFYSSGMYVRLAFAVAVHTDPDILLVDEVLAVGDEAFQRKCLDKIREFQSEGRTIILVTHSLGQVIDLCDRAVLLNRGTIVSDGDPRTAVAHFRDILEDRRLADLDQRGHVESVGPRVEAVTAAPSKPSPEGLLTDGDDLVIDMTVTSNETLADWILAVQIDNTLGQVVYGTTSRRMGVPMTPLRDRQRLRLRLTDTHFGPGKYFVSVSLMNQAGVHLHDLPQAASFDVVDYRLAVGSISAIPELTVLET